MSGTTTLGAPWQAPTRAPLCAISSEIVPVDLLTQWRRCGMISDCLADYMSYAFEHRAVARSILSTIVNELVENVAKYSADKLATARVALEHHGTTLVVESRNVAGPRHVETLGQVLAELASSEAAAVFARAIAQRRGLGLALIASDYGATLAATVAPTDGGLSIVTVRAILSASEVEQR